MAEQAQTISDFKNYNVALEKIMQDFIGDLTQNTKILIRNQEDYLTLVEYEELVKTDLQICEDMLDLLISLAEVRRDNLQSQISAKKAECAVPLAIHNAFNDLDSLKIKLKDYRTRLQDGDYSFLKTKISEAVSGGVTKNHSANAHDFNSSKVLLQSSGTDDLPVNALFSVNENSENGTPSDLTCKLGATDDLYRPRPRPQFSSEIARQIVADLDKEKMRSTSKQLFMVPSATQQNLALLMDSNSTKSVYISKLNRTVQRYDDEKTANFVHLASCTSGCGSLDGSVSDFGSEHSNQNGIRAHSPVHRIPQPNFDDTGLDEFDQLDSTASHCSVKILNSKPMYLSEIVRNVADTGISKMTTDMENLMKTAEHSTFHSQNMTSASSYHGPQRPKFTSSVGQMYNKD